MSVDIPHSDPLFTEEITPDQLQGDAPISDAPTDIESDILMDKSAVAVPVNLSEVYDILITKNQIKSWWCAKVLGRNVGDSGNSRVHVQTIASTFKARWVKSNMVRDCTHSPQVSTPHGGIVAVTLEDTGVGPMGSSATMGTVQVSQCHSQLEH